MVRAVDEPPPQGRLAFLNVSNGGVPKRPLPAAVVTVDGILGDVQSNRRHHGGPERAVSLFSLEVLEQLRREGHPVGPGATGENLTLSGLDWARVAPGARLSFAGGVLLEIASYCVPCATIRGAFTAGRVDRISQDKHPGESRVYARVLTTGTLSEGEAVTLESAVPSAGRDGFNG